MDKLKLHESIIAISNHIGIWELKKTFILAFFRSFLKYLMIGHRIFTISKL